MMKTPYTILQKIYYDYLPNRLRKYYGPKVESIYSLVKRIITIIRDLCLPVTHLTDMNEENPSRLRLLIVGRGETSRYLLKQMNLIKSERTDRTCHGRICLWNASRIDKPNINALIVEADRCFSSFLSAKGFIPIPEWVHLTLDLSLPIDEIIRRYKKRNWNNYRRITKHEYTYEVVHDLDKLEFFYHRMYVPFIKSRHGEQAYIESLAYMKNLMSYGKLLFVKLNGEYAGGFMLHLAKSIPCMTFRGVLDSSDDYIRRGISSAMYYFAICWAKQQGYTKLAFGLCRPFLDDGILQFKRRWGMDISRGPRVYRTLYLLLGKPNVSLKQFLINNPLICVDHQHLKGLLFSDHEAIHSEHSPDELKKKYAMPGLNDFSVITLK